MLCCLNPDCDRPINPENLNYCQNCGTALVALLRGRFKLIEPIGRGGFGKTYLAEDTDKLNEHCIVKQLAYQAQGTWATQKATELFKQEAKQLQQLGEHPQIPTLLAYFEEGGFLYLVQQFIQGQNLQKELQQQGKFSEAQVSQLLADLLPVLQFTHDRGVIHRDIKPENIMRRFSDGKPVLIDFGVAKLISQTVVGPTGAVGTILGSHGYAPLEQLQAGKAIYASDLYALGVTCFQILSGMSPFDLWTGSGYAWTSNWRQYVTTPISHQLFFVLDKLLQKDAANRYQSANEVLQDLQPQVLPSTIATEPHPTPPAIPPTVAASTAPASVESPSPAAIQNFAAPPTAISPQSTPPDRGSGYQYQPTAEVQPQPQPKNNLVYVVGLGVAIALGIGIVNNIPALGLLWQRLSSTKIASSPTPTASPDNTSTPTATSTPTPTSIPSPTSELKSLAKASTTATGTNSPERFLKVRAENLQSYKYKSGLFELDIPEGWTLTDNSKTGEAIVLWFDPTKNALITVDIFNAPDNFDANKATDLIQNFLKNTFGSKPGFFMEAPITQSDGSVLIVWGYLETIEGATGRILGNSYIEQVGNKVSLLTVGVLEHQFEDLREPMTRVINTYKVNASAQLP
jgi:serine/threonine protein kinase